MKIVCVDEAVNIIISASSVRSSGFRQVQEATRAYAPAGTGFSGCRRAVKLRRSVLTPDASVASGRAASSHCYWNQSPASSSNPLWSITGWAPRPSLPGNPAPTLTIAQLLLRPFLRASCDTMQDPADRRNCRGQWDAGTYCAHSLWSPVRDIPP
jgi:hypothetical protein